MFSCQKPRRKRRREVADFNLLPRYSRLLNYYFIISSSSSSASFLFFFFLFFFILISPPCASPSLLSNAVISSVPPPMMTFVCEVAYRKPIFMLSLQCAVMIITLCQFSLSAFSSSLPYVRVYLYLYTDKRTRLIHMHTILYNLSLINRDHFCN